MDLRADRPGVFAGAIEPVGSEEGRVLGCAPGVVSLIPRHPWLYLRASLVVLADTGTSLPWEVPEVENLSRNLQENNNKMSLRVRINDLNMCGLYFQVES